MENRINTCHFQTADLLSSVYFLQALKCYHSDVADTIAQGKKLNRVKLDHSKCTPCIYVDILRTFVMLHLIFATL